MIFKIELETLLNKAKAAMKIDILREQISLITTFFNKVQKPDTDELEPWEETDVLSSERYNDFLAKAERDLMLIYQSQQKVRENLLMNWNNIEQIRSTQILPELEYYDPTFTTEFLKATEFINVVPAVAEKNSKIDFLKVDPEIRASSSDARVIPYHGKKYGVWIENEISNEDGLRIATRDSSVIIDNKDSFYEVEAVALQASNPETIHEQEIIEDEINLTVTVRFVFTSPQKINYITIKPHNYSSGLYYNLTNIVLSDGTIQRPLEIEPILMNEEKTITFDPLFTDDPSTANNDESLISAIYLTFKQSEGYFIKYTIGNFTLEGDNYLIDITGDSFFKEADQYSDPHTYLQYKIDNIHEWILDVWHPDIAYDELPVLNKELGDDGFSLVDSRESRRKRWAIGIEDIDLGEHVYEDRSEIITNPINIPDGTRSIELKTKDNGLGEIYYYISVNDGLDWQRMDPVGTTTDFITEELGTTSTQYRILPQRIFLNSDISEARKEATNTGSQAYFNTDAPTIRLRAVLIKTDTVPQIELMEPIFIDHE